MSRGAPPPSTASSPRSASRWRVNGLVDPQGRRDRPGARRDGPGWAGVPAVLGAGGFVRGVLGPHRRQRFRSQAGGKATYAWTADEPETVGRPQRAGTGSCSRHDVTGITVTASDRDELKGQAFRAIASPTFACEANGWGRRVGAVAPRPLARGTGAAEVDCGAGAPAASNTAQHKCGALLKTNTPVTRTRRHSPVHRRHDPRIGT